MARKRSSSSLFVPSILLQIIATFVVCVAVRSAAAQITGEYYPSKGQTPEQQGRDAYECNQWAVSQTGFDPSRPPTTASTGTKPPQGQAAATASGQDAYRRAFATCMQGRGYMAD